MPGKREGILGSIGGTTKGGIKNESVDGSGGGGDGDGGGGGEGDGGGGGDVLMTVS